MRWPCSYLRPRPRHRKAEPKVVEAFKQSWPERIKAIAEQHPGKRLRVYFQDESRFGQQAVWTARDNHECLGRAGLSSDGDPPDGVSVPVGARCGLPRNGPRRGTAQSAVEYEDREHLPGTFLSNDLGRRARRDGLGRG